METKIIQKFKGVVKGIEVTDSVFYTSFAYIEEQALENHGLVLTQAFIREALSDGDRALYKLEDTHHYEIERAILDAIDNLVDNDYKLTEEIGEDVSMETYFKASTEELNRIGRMVQNGMKDFWIDENVQSYKQSSLFFDGHVAYIELVDGRRIDFIVRGDVIAHFIDKETNEVVHEYRKRSNSQSELDKIVENDYQLKNGKYEVIYHNNNWIDVELVDEDGNVIEDQVFVSEFDGIIDQVYDVIDNFEDYEEWFGGDIDGA